MSQHARLPDWSSLSERDRPAAIKECCERLGRDGQRLRAVAGFCGPAAQRDGVLGGMPYVAKDMIATGEEDPSWGCVRPLLKNASIAPVISRLAHAGASLIGRAEMTELAYEPSGINASRGAVLNPWNFDYVPGGSSSGSAALVAAGCCYAALGSDTGGSVRIPAHCCGVTGLKPSQGKIPLEGAMPLAPSLDTIGLLRAKRGRLGDVVARSARRNDTFHGCGPCHRACRRFRGERRRGCADLSCRGERLAPARHAC